MSASIRPTRAPSFASATARLAATVDFPTPPFPLDTATMWPRWGYATGVGAGTAARCDCGSCPITGSARDTGLAAAEGSAPAACEVARDVARLACEASFTSTRTSVTPGICCRLYLTSRTTVASSSALRKRLSLTLPSVVVAMSRTISASSTLVPTRLLRMRERASVTRSWRLVVMPSSRR